MSVLEGLLINAPKKGKKAKKAKKSGHRTAAQKRASMKNIKKAQAARKAKSTKHAVTKHAQKKHAKRHGLHAVKIVGVKHHGKKRSVHYVKPKKAYVLATKKFGSKKVKHSSVLANPIIPVNPRRRKNPARKHKKHGKYSFIVNPFKGLKGIVSMENLKEAGFVAAGVAGGLAVPFGVRFLVSKTANLPVIGKLSTMALNPKVVPAVNLAVAFGVRSLLSKNKTAAHIGKYIFLTNLVMAAKSYLMMLPFPAFTQYLSGADINADVENPQLLESEGENLEGIEQEGISGIEAEGMNGIQPDGMSGIESEAMSGIEETGMGLDVEQEPLALEEDVTSVY